VTGASSFKTFAQAEYARRLAGVTARIDSSKHEDA
jgi:hypothetical protein